MRVFLLAAGAGLSGLAAAATESVSDSAAGAEPAAALQPALESGLPLIQSFSPKDYAAGTQNWAVVQDQRGLIYVGNQDGVLEFDGQRWRRIPVANQTVARSLALAADGRVYVGAVGELGYLVPDANGALRYASLRDRLPANTGEFADVWATFATPEGVYFFSSQVLIRLRDDGVDMWHPGSTFHRAFYAGKRLFLRERELGLLELVDGKLRLIPGGERFAQERVDAVLTLGDDPADDSAILIGTRNLGFWILEQGNLRPFATEAEVALKRDVLYSSTRLADGSLVLGTLQGGIYLLAADGRLLLHLDTRSGLPDDAVYALDRDLQGGLWLALERGLARLQVGTPLTKLDARTGLRGSVYVVQRHQGRLYVGTNQGLYVLKPGAPPGFDPVTGVQSQIWDLLSLGERLLIANNDGVFQLDGDTTRQIANWSVNAMSLRPSNSSPGRVYVGLLDGLAMLQLEDGQWRDQGRIREVGEQVRTLIETSDHQLWAGTYGAGVLRLSFAADAVDAAPRIERFGLVDGLPDLTENWVYSIDGQALFATQGGVYRFNDSGRRFEPDRRFAGLFERDVSVANLTQTADGSVWLSAQSEAGVEGFGAIVPPLQDHGVYRWETRALRAATGAAVDAQHRILGDDDGVLWIGTVEGLFRYDPSIHHDYDRAFAATLREVSAAEVGVLYAGAGDALTTRVDAGQTRLRFEFAAPSFEDLESNRFQVWMEGNDSGWSPWQSEGFVEYSNLWEGNYRFRVRAKNLYDTLSTEAIFNLEVLPPWYRSVPAYFAYLLAIGVLVRGFLRWRLGQLEAQKRALAARVRERTTDLALLAEIGRDLTGSLDLERTFSTLHIKLAKLIDAEVFGLGVYDSESERVRFDFLADSGVRLRGISLSMSETERPAVWCLTQRKPLVVQCREELRHYLPRELPPIHGAPVESIVYLPLQVEDRLLGCLTVQSPRRNAFAPRQLELLNTLASYAAIAVDNSSAYTRLRQSKEDAESALTQLKETQQQLVVAEKMASLGQLVAGVAHEINTPIGIALTAASHLEDVTINQERKLEDGAFSRSEFNGWRKAVAETMRLILGSLKRASSLIASFKQVAVDQSSERRRTLQLREFLDEVAIALRPSYRKTDHEVVIDCPPGIELDTYPGALFQILTNLVGNSLTHAFAPGQRGRIHIEARADGGWLQLNYRDNGAGMTAAVLARAFEPFFTTRRGSGGSGLGLHVVYNLITQLLGGTIELISEPESGCEFRLRMPCRTPPSAMSASRVESTSPVPVPVPEAD